ncbi:MAG TPA: S26 family signal peptidase, partial [Clostridia bacterium]|nr:S26 family signal peptidase [Clostridia bacterium]
MTKKARRRPSLDELRAELRRLHSRKARRRWLASLLIVLALALSVGSYLSSTRFVLMRVSGEGMENALQAGDVVLCQ